MTENLQLPTSSDIKKVLDLGDKKLPSFPEVAAKLMEVLRDDSIAIEDLSKIVETDPGLSVRILEIVNSALYGLRNKITAISEGIVYLGLNEIKKLAIDMTVFDKLFKFRQSAVFSRTMFWRHCLSVASLSVEIAREMNYPDPEEAYVSGLLHDIGKIFLGTKGKKDYAAFISSLPATTEQVIEKERSEMGLGHDDVGAYLCVQWALPAKLSQVVKYHHQPFAHLDLSDEEKQLIAIVSLANFLCWTQGVGSFDFIHPPVLPPEVESLIDIDSFDVNGCIVRMNEQVEKISEFYQFVFPSSDQVKKNLLQANIRLSRANTRYYYQEDPLKQVKNVSSGTSESQVDFEMGKALAKAKSTHEVLDIVMYQIGRVFQPQNWSILLKDQKTSDLVFSVVVGSYKDKLTGAKLKKGEGVAGYVMDKGESVIVEDVQKDKRFSGRVDQHTGFKTKSIIGTPLKTGDKVFGVIELINRIDEVPFDTADLSLLESIAEYAAIAIERSYYNQALTKLATKDALTGLNNRWSFDRAVGDKNTMLKKYGSVFSILVVDIRGLRKIVGNSSFPDTDELLKEIANAITKTKRKEDDLFRYGESTFVMMLAQTYSDGSERVRNRLSSRLSLMASEHGNLPIESQIYSHTVSIEDTAQLKKIIVKSLSESIEPTNDEASVSYFEYSLQELIEGQKDNRSEENSEKADTGKMVSLGGRFVRLKTGESGHMRVERVSLSSVGFRISRSHRIQINDFLDVHFTLDNINKDRIERRVVVRELKGNLVNAQYYNPPPYAKKLGFYLMS